MGARHPATGLYRFDDAPGIPLVPYLTDEDRAAGRGGKAIVSCLQPSQLSGATTGTVANFANSYPADVRARVLDRWAAYGFQG